MDINKFDLIVVNGDSFTDGGGATEQWNYENPNNTVNKIAWAEFLSKKLNIPLINLAEGGSSNEAIIRRTIDFFENKKCFWHGNQKSFINDDNKNILYITQWSYLNRISFNLTLDDKLNNIQINNTPQPDLLHYFRNSYKMSSENSQWLFDNIKKSTFSRAALSDYSIDSNDFVFKYYMFQQYLKSKPNLTSLNWFYVTFNYTKEHNSVDAYSKMLLKLQNTIDSFEFDNLISETNVYMKDCKTVFDETSGAISDMHIGVHSNELMAERLHTHLKNKYGI